MKIRADIVELIGQGFNNEEIARHLNVDPKTVSLARQRLGADNAPARRPATSVERLYAEAVPTGQVRDYKPARMPMSPAQQAANRAALLAGLRTPAR
ncbi:helix-turn-helix domain-containing protein [Streptomyces sp. NPDC002994]|uniref:helix-turn-helix domain-containing protein n=1 Tax=Streptomyces sp. NPDC002994 TaxID=3154441 RepID=UPI0033B21F2D